MKNVFMILAAALLTASVFLYSQPINAQTPNKMSYQAVVRNSSNNLVQNSPIGMRISILQGSIMGTVVYSETQTPISNANGLVNIEIGGGTGFNAINWANGPYFIKTETDITGGTNYTITGTSQLLSVPYALHSKTAETLTGGFTETDPIFGVHISSGITSANISNWNAAFGWGNHSGLYRPIGYVSAWSEITDKPTFATIATSGSYNDLSNKPSLFDGTWVSLTGKPTFAIVSVSGSYNDLSNKPITNGSETKVTDGTNITVTGTGTTANPYIINAISHYIGEYYGGGIVFYVYDGGQHGLIAATADQSTGIQWYNETYKYTGITSDGVGAGEMNTAMIVAIQISDNVGSNFAAKVCANYNTAVSGVNYGDWYLPSRFELGLLYKQKSVVGGFDNAALYWSSTEYSISYAWVKYFGDGTNYQEYKNNTNHVRAIRAF